MIPSKGEKKRFIIREQIFAPIDYKIFDDQTLDSEKIIEKIKKSD